MCRIISFPCMAIQKSKISPQLEKIQVFPHDICGEILNSPHLACIWWKNVATYGKFVLFCCKISFVIIYTLCREICFVTIYAFLCGEKLSQNFSLWRKNDKYEVWRRYSLVSIDVTLWRAENKLQNDWWQLNAIRGLTIHLTSESMKSGWIQPEKHFNPS